MFAAKGLGTSRKERFCLSVQRALTENGKPCRYMLENLQIGDRYSVFQVALGMYDMWGCGVANIFR